MTPMRPIRPEIARSPDAVGPRPMPDRQPGASGDPDLGDRLDRLDRLAAAMDSRFSLFGIRFGWDFLIGLVPGVGDVAALGPAGYILLEGHRMGAPKPLLAKMGAWVAADWAVGTVPLVGDLLDVGIKANRRNVALLRKHFEGRAIEASERRIDRVGAEA